MKRKSINIYQVDAFTDNLFQGNPTAICILDKPIEDKIMQYIALEMNLSETAFILPKENNLFQLRWFTPKEEVSLCGHATIGASKVLFNQLNIDYDEIIYETKSGILKAKKNDGGIILDFPQDEAIVDDSIDIENLLKSMGIFKCKKIIYGKRTRKIILHLDSEEEVIKIQPNFEEMRKLDLENIKGVGITAKGNKKYDFISRYFNPWVGVNEDPVTGSVHTLLATYWSNILDKRSLKAYQASQRGGEILLRLKNDNRLELVGEAVIVLEGQIYIDK